MGIGLTGGGIGQVVISPLLESSIEHFGLAEALTMLGVSMSLCFVPVYFIYQASSKDEQQNVVAEAKSLTKIYKEIFSSHEVVLILIYSGEIILHY